MGLDLNVWSVHLRGLLLCSLGSDAPVDGSRTCTGRFVSKSLLRESKSRLEPLHNSFQSDFFVFEISNVLYLNI